MGDGRFTNEDTVRNQDSEQSNDFVEETAAEVTPGAADLERNEENTIAQEQTRDNTDEIEGRGMGIFALTLSLLSLLFLPVLLGAAGIIVGFIARQRGANALGNWAIAVGAISIVVTLFLAPFF